MSSLAHTDERREKRNETNPIHLQLDLLRFIIMLLDPVSIEERVKTVDVVCSRGEVGPDFEVGLEEGEVVHTGGEGLRRKEREESSKVGVRGRMGSVGARMRARATDERDGELTNASSST